MRALEIYGDVIKEADGFIRQLDETIRLTTYNFLMNEERKDGMSIGAPKSAIPSSGERTFSPQELIHVCGASSLMDKAVVLGYWLEEYEGKESFTSAELKSAFLSAREPAPVNPSDVVAKLEGARKLMKAEKIGKAQSYRLTRTAINQVQEWLDANSADAERRT
jgi:hypothetical protein